MKRVATYLRISRVDQNEALQADETQGLVTHRGWACAEEYVDRGVSGAKDRRPALDRMLADARRRKFDVLVVWKSDRLFRSMKHMVTTLDELSAMGIDFVSVSEPFDTTTPQGRLLFHVVAAFAEFERGLLIERTKAGMAAARRRGARVGRPPVRVDVDRARELRQAGASMRKVAETLGVPLATLHRALAAVPKGFPDGPPRGA